jgi:predicted NAD-dependent protein-ADP-ribosyltransferase YbiA (DUF1768 family)/SAM-dependent methyltransferase
MELFPAEAETLKKITSEWLEHSERELEATFGVNGEVGATEFLNVAKRLKAKGYTALPQEDRLTITTPDHSRFTLSGLGVIQQYCRDNRLAGKPFVAMIKDRAGVESNLDLDDYTTRVKVRREIPLGNDDARVKEILATWPQQKKAFRLIRRWTFQGNGVIFDLSMVRSTKKDLKGNYVWVRNFTDQDITTLPPTYEIEVELVRGENTATPEKALASVVRGMGEVLRGLQKHTLLIRKSVKDKVINAYKTLVGDDKFRGVAPVTLEMRNMVKEKEPGVPNIRDSYNVTDKADGLRVLGFCDSKGELFMIDMGMNVYKTGLRRESLRDSLVDGEFVTQTKDNRAIQQLLLFDIYIAPESKKVDSLPFYTFTDVESRFTSLKAWTDGWNSGDGAKIIATGITAHNRLQISHKAFFFAQAGDLEIFQLSSQVLSRPTIYNTDGLILTPNASPLPPKAGTAFLEQFKWKPSEDNTIDFLVMTQKTSDSNKEKEELITTSIRPESNATIRFKTLRLYVGSSTDPAYDNPRDTILLDRGLPTGQRKGFKGREYKPVPFNPKDFPDTMASVCNLEIQSDPDTNEEFIMTERSMEPIQDKSIVEMRYDSSQPIGWRWKPIRVRYDKTERLQRGILGRTLNSDKVAESVWNSIHDPITESMIRTGAEQPSEIEMLTMARVEEGVTRRYYERKAPEQDLMIVRGLRDFHNKWVKERVLLAAGLKGGNKNLLDLAVGKAADLQKWRRNGVGFVMGIDYSGENIRDRENGAYRRYLDTIVNARGGFVPPMVFAIGDSSKPIVNGRAGVTEEEGDILRAVFGRVNPVGAVPTYVSKTALGKLRDGADCIACMFALHYFFKDSQTFNGFLENIRDTLKVGGYFIACCFDGDKVFELLDNVEMGESRIGKEKDTEIWSITKKYEYDEMPTEDDAFGMAIDVEFISIGTSHTEYLVPFKLFVDKMRTIGCELMTEAECKEVGLKNSTNLFDKTYEMAKAAGQNYVMNSVVSQYSFLNRWMIFKRKGASASTTDAELKIASAAAPNGAAAPSVLGMQGPASSVLGMQGPAPPITTEVPYSAATNMRTLADAITNTNTNTKTNTKNKKTIAANTLVPQETVMPAIPEKSYSVNDVFLFYHDAALQDKLKINDKSAGRWLSPYAPFPIQDPSDPGTKYPTLEHYLAAMRYKVATDQPQLAASVFGEEGTIHQKFLRDRLAASQGGRKPLTEDQEHDFLKQEMTEVRFATRPTNIKKYKAVFDEAKWASQKDALLREGLKQRWERDARLRKIVEAARAQGKYLLYYTGATVVGDLGGVRRTDGKIDGENKIGRILMELAGFTA